MDRLRTLHDGERPFLFSTMFETRPVDCPAGSANFLNAVVEFSSRLPALDLLSRLQAIEVALGRPAAHSFHEPRTIDLDLLYCDNLHISHPRLTLPHPRMLQRSFVLAPLAEICPERMLICEDGEHRPVRECLNRLS